MTFLGFAGFILWAIIAPASGQEDAAVSIATAVTPDHIARGGWALCTVTITGPYRIRKPSGGFGHDLDPVDDVSATWLSTSERTGTADGILTFSETTTYLLEPTTAGTFMVGGAKTRFGAIEMRAGSKLLTVTAEAASGGFPAPRSRHDLVPGEGVIFVRASVDNRTPWVGQQVTYRLDHYDNIYDTETDFRAPLTDGFWVVNLPDMQGERTVLGGQRYWHSSYRRALFPTGYGTLTIGAAALYYSASKGTASQYGVLTTEPLTVTARTLPSAGRPQGFAGAVGSFRISVEPESDMVRSGERMTLHVTVEGSGNLDLISDVRSPDLEGFTLRNVRAGKSEFEGDATLRGKRTWDYALVTGKPGRWEIGPFTLPYFDPAAAEYRTAYSEPVAVTVTAVGAAASGDQGFGIGPVRRLARDIRFLKPDRVGFETGPQPLYARWWFPLLYLAGAGGFAGGIAARVRQETLKSDPARKRRTEALNTAETALADAREFIHRGDARGLCAAVRETLAACIADMTGRARGGLSIPEARRTLEDASIPPSLVERTVALLDRCDTVVYAPAAEVGALRPIFLEAKAIVRELHRALAT